VIQHHLPAMMQVLSNELEEYNMNLVTTKCLNTAVMMWYLFLGDQSSLPYLDKNNNNNKEEKEEEEGENVVCNARVCDSRTVTRRGQAARQSTASPEEWDRHPLNPRNVAQKFGEEILRDEKETDVRTLFYVILTDAELPFVSSTKDEDRQKGGGRKKTRRMGGGGEKDDEFFPGHVFVIEKIKTPEDDRLHFNVYQSYINNYDLVGHQILNKSLSMSIESAQSLVRNLCRMYDQNENAVWDAETTRFWKDFTHVDCSRYEGHQFSRQSYMCYTTCKTRNCTSKLRKLVAYKLDELTRAMDTGYVDPSAIYGDPSRYAKPRMNTKRKSNSHPQKPLTDGIPHPLTNAQMKQEFAEILGKL